MRFAMIDIGQSSAVDHKIDIKRADLVAHPAGIAEIKRLMVETCEIEFVSILAHERSPEPATRADD